MTCSKKRRCQNISWYHDSLLMMQMRKVGEPSSLNFDYLMKIMSYLSQSLVFGFQIGNSIFETVSETLIGLLKVFAVAFIFCVPIFAAIWAKGVGVGVVN